MTSATETGEGETTGDAAADADGVARDSDGAATEPDSPWPRRLLVVGGLLLVVGLATPVWLGWVTAPEGLALSVGLLTVILGGRFAILTARGSDSPVAFPAVETRQHVTPTGARFERTVRGVGSDVAGRAIRSSNRTVDRLRDLAVSSLEAQGHSPEDAQATLEAGDWTDDEVAAAFLDDGAAGDGGLGSQSGWIRSTAPFERRVRRTVGAIADRSRAASPSPSWIDDEGGSRARTDWEPGLAPTGRWRGAAGLGLVSLGLAALTVTTGPALVGAVLLGVAGYARLFDPPEPTLVVDRTFDDADPRPGEAVTVTVAVENAGAVSLTDCRLVDAVPAALAVVDGSPRHATALRQGERTTFQYTVRAVYGDHRFERVHVHTRDVAGGTERRTAVSTEAATLRCEPATIRESVPLHPETAGLTGRVPADVGGSGTEFHSTRAYRPGDPLRRIDWTRLARTGDLATLRFREEHAATVVALVDAREPAFRSPMPTATSAVDRSLGGATQVVGTLLDDGDRVGFASVEPDWEWVGPGAGTVHRARLEDTIEATVEASDAAGDDDFFATRYVRQLRRHLPAESQLVVFSPLVDEEAVDLVRRLHGYGYPVTVFSPDPTTTATVGGTVARLERERLLASVRRAGIRVVDWAGDDSIRTAIERGRRGWRQ